MLACAVAALVAVEGGAKVRLPPGKPDPTRVQRQEVLVSTAASLADVMETIAGAYEKRTGVRVVVNTGASNTLARQIAAGAAVDLFVSADESQMDVVRREIVAGTRINLLSNQLAVAVPADRPRTLRSVRDLLDPAFRRVAIGDPAAVPAGVYAKAYLEKLGIWKAMSAKAVPSASVRLALAAVENGAADAAIVYRTDIATTRRASLALSVPVTDGPRIVYPAAVVRSGHNHEGATRLLAWLQSAEAARIFEASGFIPVANPGRSAAAAAPQLWRGREGRFLPATSGPTRP
jgi:molybdate transport system substrate-binding protein